MKNKIKDIIKEFSNPREEVLNDAVRRICCLFDVSNSALMKCCGNPNIDEMESQSTDCDGDNETCTITYCKNCKQTLSIEP